jgi:hypothetical protein
MNIKFYIINLLVILTTTSCMVSTQDTLTGPRERRTDYSILNQMKIEINNTLSNQGLFVIGCSSHLYPLIQHIGDYFGTTQYRYTSPDEVRPLLCQIMDMYLTAVNNEKRIRPFLKEYPFPARHLDTSIRFLDQDRDTLGEPYIEYAQCIKGTLSYFKRDKDGKRKVIYQEPFETAYSIYLKNKENSHDY